VADWDPELYHRFRRYRAEPVEAILARLTLGPAEAIVDLGCGTGEHTVDLARRTRHGTVVGIDSSPAMLERANQLRDGLEQSLKARVTFVCGDFHNLDPQSQYSVIFSNAALQWATDHRALLTRWFGALRPGGQMVVQVPANDIETAQLTMVALAHEETWSALIGGLYTPSRTVGEPEVYSAMLREIGYVDVDCYYHTFRHPMGSPAEIVEWSRATALRPFLERLAEDKQPSFVAELTRRLERAYGTDGPLVFNFRRLFMWARRPAA
jgi:trans-aconitate 2-methyltransferase